MKSNTVSIMLACNNRNGLMTGRFDAIRIHTSAEVIAQIECPVTRVTEIWLSGHLPRVRMGRFLLTVKAYGHHVGNLVWNEYRVLHTPAYVRFVDVLKRRGAKCDEIRVPAHMEPNLADWADLVRLERRAAS